VAFQVLHDWESLEGAKPHRVFIKNIGRIISQTTGRLDNAYYILKNHTKGTAVTTTSLNIILSACALRGDVESSFSTFDDFDAHGVMPDENSFEFLMESMSTCVGEKVKKKMPLEDGYDDAILEVWKFAKEKSIDRNVRICTHFVDVLSNHGRMEEATQEILQNGSCNLKGHGILFGMISIGYAKIGNFEKAAEVVKYSEEKVPKKIKNTLKKLTKDATPTPMQEMDVESGTVHE